ncbi:protein-L-isoaspartate O-methyltransferase domain-containing protein 1 isoform X6 [Orcinus orca]|uniref:protein-L-isoaspartate O-methyltransferase domain-containing protein 1 isoform X6 n=1 Tax=Orcinus orca TaxID=9733 RepID=UPI00144297D8|nr:protein-L-isoaspartate O-methyltransferase domain-containing protein 1 isoform X6 [Orcinus orca]
MVRTSARPAAAGRPLPPGSPRPRLLSRRRPRGWKPPAVADRQAPTRRREPLSSTSSLAGPSSGNSRPTRGGGGGGRWRRRRLRGGCSRGISLCLHVFGLRRDLAWFGLGAGRVEGRSRMGRPRALLISASSRRPSRPPPSAHARSPPARRPRRSGFPNQRPGSAPPPGGGGGGRVVLAAAPAAAEPAESQRLTCARCGGPTDRLATGHLPRQRIPRFPAPGLSAELWTLRILQAGQQAGYLIMRCLLHASSSVCTRFPSSACLQLKLPFLTLAHTRQSSSSGLYLLCLHFGERPIPYSRKDLTW